MTSGLPWPAQRQCGKAHSASRGWGALASGSDRGFLIACAVTMLALVTSRRWPAPLPSHARPARAGRLAGTSPRRPRSCGQQRLALPGLGRPPLREALGNARSQR